MVSAVIQVDKNRTQGRRGLKKYVG